MIVDIPSAIQAICTTASLGVVAYMVNWRDSHIKLATKFDEHDKHDTERFNEAAQINSDKFKEVIDRIAQSEQNIIQIIRDKK